jgi:hypothetical protein
MTVEINWTAISAISTFFACAVALSIPFIQHWISNRKKIGIDITYEGKNLKDENDNETFRFSIINNGEKNIYIERVWFYIPKKLFPFRKSSIEELIYGIIQKEIKPDTWLMVRRKRKHEVNDLIINIINLYKIKKNDRIYILIKDMGGKKHKLKTKYKYQDFLTNILE